MTDAPCYFFELPLELREYIYADLLTPEKVVICTEDNSRSLNGKSEGEIISSCYYASASTSIYRYGWRASTAVLRTCKQIAHEVAPFLVKTDRLEVRPAMGVGTRGTKKHTINIKRLRDIKKLQLLEVHTPCFGGSGRYSEYLLQQLHPHLTIDRLRIDIRPHRLNVQRSDKYYELSAYMRDGLPWLKAESKLTDTALFLHPHPDVPNLEAIRGMCWVRQSQGEWVDPSAGVTWWEDYKGQLEDRKLRPQLTPLVEMASTVALATAALE